MENRNRIAAAVCGLAWLVAAIHPVDRQTWLLENILLVLFALLLFLTRQHLRFSNASSLFLSLFILLHIAGAHYTYDRMPLGYWARDAFHLARNPSDRVTHFAFGFLLFSPVRELLLRFSGITPAWSLWLAAGVLLGASGFFEIFQSIVAETVAPGQGVSWLGGQGDDWDAQNDMLCALIGSLLMLALAAFFGRRRRAR